MMTMRIYLPEMMMTMRILTGNDDHVDKLTGNDDHEDILNGNDDHEDMY
jgi:hypothetical protein